MAGFKQPLIEKEKADGGESERERERERGGKFKIKYLKNPANGFGEPDKFIFFNFPSPQFSLKVRLPT